jgi:hypothetical protein
VETRLTDQGVLALNHSTPICLSPHVLKTDVVWYWTEQGDVRPQQNRATRRINSNPWISNALVYCDGGEG